MPPVSLPECPHLPAVELDKPMDWRALHTLGSDRGELFYLRCLRYAQYLWRHGMAARAILAADRALFADLRGEETALRQHPLPYAALAWMIAHTPAGVFLGNPRVHYQHLADRVREPRQLQRSARAWAAWYLARIVRPQLPPDPRHAVSEPDAAAIADALHAHGIPEERATWQLACDEAAAWRVRTTGTPPRDDAPGQGA